MGQTSIRSWRIVAGAGSCPRLAPQEGQRKWRTFALAFRVKQRNTFICLYPKTGAPGEIPMRSFILSVSADRWLTPIRNTVLAHAGYAVIPALSAEMATAVLSKGHVSAMLIAHSIPVKERQRLCAEGRRRGVPSVVLDRGEQAPESLDEVHVDPSDGPEAFLGALAKALKKARES